MFKLLTILKKVIVDNRGIWKLYKSLFFLSVIIAPTKSKRTVATTSPKKTA